MFQQKILEWSKAKIANKNIIRRSPTKTQKPGPSHKLTLFYESICIHLLFTCILSLSNARFAQICVTWVAFYATYIRKIIKMPNIMQIMKYMQKSYSNTYI